MKKLLDSGSAENPSQGYWRIGPEASETEDDASDSQGVSAQVAFEPLPAADVVLGAQADEKGAVYLYYLPAYRLQSEAENATVWPCKIGWTDRDPLVRILSQAATALPEKPHVALIVYTEHPLALEAAIHGVLTLRGRKVDNSPGKEWFLTSPEEVKTLVEFFDPRFKNR